MINFLIKAGEILLSTIIGAVLSVITIFVIIFGIIAGLLSKIGILKEDKANNFIDNI